MSYTVPENIADVRKAAWATRRAKYGPAGHASSYARGPLGTRAMRFLASMVADGTLSEGQVCQATGVDRVALRRLVDSPIIAERREAAGKIGDDNAPQTQGPEVDARRLPDVQTP